MAYTPIPDLEQLATAIKNPGRLVLGPTTTAGAWPFNGQPLGVRAAAKIEWIGRYQDIIDPASGQFRRRIRRQPERPRIAFLLEPPWDANALAQAFNQTSGASLASQYPQESRLEGGVIPVAQVASLGAPIALIPFDLRQQAVLFTYPVPALTFLEATEFSNENGAYLPFVFDPAEAINSTDAGFPYTPTKPFWQVARWENITLP